MAVNIPGPKGSYYDYGLLKCVHQPSWPTLNCHHNTIMSESNSWFGDNSYRVPHQTCGSGVLSGFWIMGTAFRHHATK